MRPFSWDEDKNKELQTGRSVSFEQVRDEIKAGRFRIEKNTSGNHPGQSIYLVIINSYVHVVPFRETEEAILLITIFPSRYWQEKTRGVLL
ncbi:toxin [Bdellovibrionota bacterium FG-1]